MRFRFLLAVLMLGLSRLSLADDNAAENVRPVPPPGIMITDADRAELQSGVDALGKKIAAVQDQYSGDAAMTDLLPDVQVFYNAVRYPLKYNEFYNRNEINTARTLLKIGNERADELASTRKASWTNSTGLVVRGYKSKIDGSIQPYGLVIPENYNPLDRLQPAYRLDLWCHGRGETLTELAFVNDRLHNRGEFTPENTVVLHLYGRYCCANKFAGEVDAFEAIDAVKRAYHIDPNRIVVRGFSMGGAACWQFATHFAGEWAAAAPGAGFSETPDFLKVFQNETLKPTWYEQKLWHLYDSTDYAVNLFNCPTVAYSGEVDSQRQAAVMMEKALGQEGMTLVHVIGPKAGHFYEPNAKKEVAAKIDALAAIGRDALPAKIRFTTWTLRYNRMKWIRVDGMEKHWSRARLDAETGKSAVNVKTQNVEAFSILMPKFDLTSATKDAPFRPGEKVSVSIDGQTVAETVRYAGPDDLWKASFRKTSGKWAGVRSENEAGLHKRHGLQGPIDDAFMDSFVMVRPTGAPLNPKVGDWAHKEMDHAIDAWRKQFRGEAPVKDDTAVTQADIANSNLILWGDPQSNAILKRIAGSLPLKWDIRGIRVGNESFTEDHNVPVMIYPNPLNPKRYIVLNSGFTFREYDYLNNARQNAKLPDWAIIDINTPPSSKWPGAVSDAGFFNEQWQWTADRGK